MSGRAELEAFIAGVESLVTMNEDVAREAEKPVADVARRSAEAGRAPDGETWAPLANGGGKALKGAAAAITSSAKGTAIRLEIGEPYVFHNHGAGGSSETPNAKRARARARRQREATGKASKFHAPKRQILPGPGELPDDMRKAISTTADRVFARAMKGGA